MNEVEKLVTEVQGHAFLYEFVISFGMQPGKQGITSLFFSMIVIE